MSSSETPSFGVNRDMDAAIGRILEHLPIKADPVLTLLKGHMLVEETVRKFVDAKVVSRHAVDEAQLSFHQTCCLAKALYPCDELGWLWDAAKKLNRLRNDLAHNLEPIGFNKRLEEFQELVEWGSVLPTPPSIQNQMGRLAVTLAKLIAFIYVGLESRPGEAKPSLPSDPKLHTPVAVV